MAVDTFDNPIILWIYLPFFLLSITVGNVILVNYIIVNRNNMYKTLIDELFGQLALFALIGANCLIQPLTMVRMIFGPIPDAGDQVFILTDSYDHHDRMHPEF